MTIKFTHLPSFTMPVKTTSDVDRLLIYADYALLNGRRSSAMITTAIVYIRRKNPKLGSLRYLEGRLRALHSSSYLLAVPARFAPANVVPRMLDTDRPAKYFLWISVNGEQEAEVHAEQFGIDREQNLDWLEETGVLMIGDA